jgi:hypothetical protein
MTMDIGDRVLKDGVPGTVSSLIAKSRETLSS